MTALRNTIVTMMAVLVSFFVALAIKEAAGLDASVMVMAVAVALTNARRHYGQDGRERVQTVVLFAVIAGLASLVGRLMWETPWVGDTLFTLALSGAIWARRFGPRWSRIGSLIALPFIAVLVTPVAPLGDSAAHTTIWTIVISGVVVLIVNVTQYVAQRLEFVAAPTAPLRQPRARPTRSGVLPASTRMALQMAVGLGLAFFLGRELWPLHWSWVVLTAYIVASGNRGRGDVLHKSGLRIAGAVGGAVVATLVAGRFSPGDNWALVLIFAIMGLAVWLRERSYAYWAAGVTAMLSLLYGYLGVTGNHLILERVAGIVLGAAIAVGCAWFILPVKSGDVLRRRFADALAALTDWLTAARRVDLEQLQAERERFDHAVSLLEQLSPSFSMHRTLARIRLAPSRGAARHGLIDGVVDCRDATDLITDAALAEPDVLRSAELRQTLESWQQAVVATRRSLRRKGARLN